MVALCCSGVSCNGTGGGGQWDAGVSSLPVSTSPHSPLSYMSSFSILIRNNYISPHQSLNKLISLSLHPEPTKYKTIRKVCPQCGERSLQKSIRKKPSHGFNPYASQEEVDEEQQVTAGGGGGDNNNHNSKKGITSTTGGGGRESEKKEGQKFFTKIMPAKYNSGSTPHFPSRKHGNKYQNQRGGIAAAAAAGGGQSKDQKEAVINKKEVTSRVVDKDREGEKDNRAVLLPKSQKTEKDKKEQHGMQQPREHKFHQTVEKDKNDHDKGNACSGDKDKVSGERKSKEKNATSANTKSDNAKSSDRGVGLQRSSSMGRAKHQAGESTVAAVAGIGGDTTDNNGVEGELEMPKSRGDKPKFTFKLMRVTSQGHDPLPTKEKEKSSERGGRERNREEKTRSIRSRSQSVGHSLEKMRERSKSASRQSKGDTEGEANVKSNAQSSSSGAEKNSTPKVERKQSNKDSKKESTDATNEQVRRTSSGGGGGGDTKHNKSSSAKNPLRKSMKSHGEKNSTTAQQKTSDKSNTKKKDIEGTGGNTKKGRPTRTRLQRASSEGHRRGRSVNAHRINRSRDEVDTSESHDPARNHNKESTKHKDSDRERTPHPHRRNSTSDQTETSSNARSSLLQRSKSLPQRSSQRKRISQEYHHVANHPSTLSTYRAAFLEEIATSSVMKSFKKMPSKIHCGY